MGYRVFLAILIAELLFFAWQIKDKHDDLNQRVRIYNHALVNLTMIVVVLALFFAVFESPQLRIVNVLVLLVLLPAQFILINPIKQTKWYQPAFWMELALSALVRPLIYLDGLPPFLSAST